MSGPRYAIGGGGLALGNNMRKEWAIGVGSLVSLRQEGPQGTLKGEVLAHDPTTRFMILKVPSAKAVSQWDVHMVNLRIVKEFRVLSEGSPGKNFNNSSCLANNTTAAAAATASSSHDSSNNSCSPLSNNSGDSSGNSSPGVNNNATQNGIKMDYPPPPPLPSLNVQKLENRLKDSIEKKKRYLMGYKEGVSTEGQTLFRAISKTLDEVFWEGHNIVVMDMVTISPPYRPENLKGSRHMEAFNHVKKIVEKHVKDQAQMSSSQKKDSSNSNYSGGSSSSSSGGGTNNSSKKSSPPKESLFNGGSSR